MIWGLYHYREYYHKNCSQYQHQLSLPICLTQTFLLIKILNKSGHLRVHFQEHYLQLALSKIQMLAVNSIFNLICFIFFCIKRIVFLLALKKYKQNMINICNQNQSYHLFLPFNINTLEQSRKQQIAYQFNPQLGIKFEHPNRQRVQKMAQAKLKCKRNGCRKQYTEQLNTETSCNYHPGKPIFHDTKKGWTCCNKIVYDWDEFQKLPACATAKHSNVKQQQGHQFFKSNTVSNAQNAIEKEAKSNIVIQDINKYNAEIEAKKKKEQEQKAPEQKKLFKSKSGKLKCINQGCAKKYVQEQNNEDACHFHKGQPVFHDLKKYWTCCGKQTFDWDEFMKLPKCCNGFHSPKLV